MKKSLFLWMTLFSLWGITACDMNEEDNVGPIVCPGAENTVMLFTVDYTTNTFLRGYSVEIFNDIDSLVLVGDYKAPGDFGSIAWETAIGDRLFFGTIIWMGKGEQTYPEGSGYPETAYSKNYKLQPQPQWAVLSADGEDKVESPDFDAIWPAISQFDMVQQGINNNPSNPLYIYLYQPSVGVGDPKDWYWVIFMHCPKSSW